MKIIACALNCEIQGLQHEISTIKNVKIVNIGVGAKKMNFIDNIKAEDYIINIGICAGKKVGEIFLCNKIIGDKTYYPDIFYNNGIPYSTITTTNDVVSSTAIKRNNNMLFDMEAANIFKYASKVLAPSQIYFIKIVSDSGISNTKMGKEYITQLVNNHAHTIKNFIEKLPCPTNTNILQIEKDLEKYAQHFKLSATSKEQAKQLLKYAKICNINYSEYFNKFLKEPTSKKQALKIWNNFKKIIT